MFQRYSESDEEREDKSVGCGDILRSRSRSLPVDDSEVILRRRRHKHEHSSEPEPGKCKQRLRIVSCPDESYLHQLCTDGDIDLKMVDLRKICREGEEFLEPKSCDYQANSDDEVFRFDKDHDEESKRIKLVPIESLDTLVDNSSSNVELETVDRLGTLFETEILKAVNLVLSLPDGDHRIDMIHSLQYQLRKLKKQVTENCHAVIFSMIVNVE